MYAIIESCGKQYKVTEGDVVFFEKLDTEEGKKVTFDKVVLVSNEGKIEVGAPYVKGVKVEGKVVSHGKGKKIIVYKYKIVIFVTYVSSIISWMDCHVISKPLFTFDIRVKRTEPSFCQYDRIVLICCFII